MRNLTKMTLHESKFKCWFSKLKFSKEVTNQNIHCLYSSQKSTSYLILAFCVSHIPYIIYHFAFHIIHCIIHYLCHSLKAGMTIRAFSFKAGKTTWILSKGQYLPGTNPKAKYLSNTNSKAQYLLGTNSKAQYLPRTDPKAQYLPNTNSKASTCVAPQPQSPVPAWN